MSWSHAESEKLVLGLETEFSELDTSLIRSIASDYVLPAQLPVLKANLQELSDLAQLDDVTDFDPAGTGGQAYTEQSAAAENSEGKSSWVIVLSSNTVSISSPQHLTFPHEQDTATEDSFDTLQYDHMMIEMEELSSEDQVCILQQMFVNQKQVTIESTLKEAKGNYSAAVDILLSNEYMQDANLIQKGVDGFFFGSDDEARKPKACSRGRGREKKSQSSKAKFKRLENDTASEDSQDKSSPVCQQSKPTRKLTFDLPPPPLPKIDDGVRSSRGNENGWVQVVGRKSGPHFPQSSKARPVVSSHTPLNSKHYAGAVRAAHMQSHSGGPTAQETTRARQADQLAHDHSSWQHVDLHYMDRNNARRIALERTNAWWNSLGDLVWQHRYRNMVADGFRIIVGSGHHSKHGRPILGGAVMKALTANSWIFSIHDGVFLVHRKKETPRYYY